MVTSATLVGGPDHLHILGSTRAFFCVGASCVCLSTCACTIGHKRICFLDTTPHDVNRADQIVEGPGHVPHRGTPTARLLHRSVPFSALLMEDDQVPTVQSKSPFRLTFAQLTLTGTGDLCASLLLAWLHKLVRVERCDHHKERYPDPAWTDMSHL